MGSHVVACEVGMDMALTRSGRPGGCSSGGGRREVGRSFRRREDGGSSTLGRGNP